MKKCGKEENRTFSKNGKYRKLIFNYARLF